MRAERAAVGVRRECESWDGTGGPAVGVGRECEVRGWQLMWRGRARNGEAVDWAVEGCQWMLGGSARAEGVAADVGRGCESWGGSGRLAPSVGSVVAERVPVGVWREYKS